MTLPRVRGYSLHEIHHLRTSDHRVAYHVELWTQPLHRWLAARTYHRYDMTAFRLPGFKTVEQLTLAWKMRRGRPAIPWGAEQDCRCYLLTHRGRTVLAAVEVDKQTYDRLKAR